MRDAVRRRAGDVAPVEHDAAGARRELPGQEIEQRRLAGAVGADDRVQAAGLDAQADIVDRGKRAERLGQVLCLEDCHDQKRDQASTTPPRKKSTTITNATPRSSGQRAQITLIDSESQMKTIEPMIGP